jgi:hypothetical protein
MTWAAINRQIAPSGPIEDEADVLIKSVVDLITAFVTVLQKEPRKSPAKIRVVRRRVINKNFEDEDEVLLELNVPLSEEITDALNSKVRKAIQSDTRPPAA